MRALAKQGHQVSLIAKQLGGVYCMMAEGEFDVFQAPVFLGARKSTGTRCYADILKHNGYESPKTLVPLVSGWRSLINMLTPDAVVFDFAPTAQLACLGLGIPTFVLGGGYYHPEPGCPSVDMQSWSQAVFSDGAKSESAVLETIRGVLPNQQTQAAEHLSDLLGCSHFFIPHHPIFDLYRTQRAQVTYLGPIPKSNRFPEPKWHTNAKQRVFVYLRAEKQQVDTVISALALNGFDAVCYLPGVEDKAIRALANGRLIISETPYDLNTSLAQADLVICHAGLGVIGDAMYQGCPVLLLPTQPEQIHNTLRAEELGVGLGLRRDQTPESVAKVIRRLLTEPQWRARSQLIAQEYHSLVPADPIGHILQMIESSLS